MDASAAAAGAAAAAAAAAAATVAALAFASWAEIRVHWGAIFLGQARQGRALGSFEASFHEGALQRQVGCQHRRIGSAAVDLLAAGHSWVAEAKVEHQVSYCALEEGLAAQSSEWGFGHPKPHCWPQEFEKAAAVAAAHVSLVPEAPPKEVVVPEIS